VIGNEKAYGETFNLTHGDARTLNDLAKIVEASIPGTTIKYIPRDKLIPFRGTLSVDKARKMLGYKPKMPIEKGIPKYVDWYLSMEDIAKNVKGTGKNRPKRPSLGNLLNQTPIIL
jgi:nucleoside-diphosphate-sugar epimerase